MGIAGEVSQHFVDEPRELRRHRDREARDPGPRLFGNCPQLDLRRRDVERPGPNDFIPGEQIAAELGVSRKMVEKYVSRALDRLRKRLRPEKW